jgi:putative membrane protein
MEVKIESNQPKSILLRLVVNTLSIFATAYILPGIHVVDFYSALWVAIVLAVLNVTLKPLLILITLPFTLVTFGLFLMVINALVILLASKWVDGFSVDGFWWAILFSLLMSAINGILYNLGGSKQR